MDPKQPVVLQILESVKDSYMSHDFKTCQQLLAQLKDIVDQKASVGGTDNDKQLVELSNRPLDMKSIDPNLWGEEEEEDAGDEQDDDFTKIPYDDEWITKTNCVEYTATIGDMEDAKEDEEEDEDAKEDEEEDDDPDAKEDEDYEVDEEEDEDAKEDEEEDDDPDAEEDEDYKVDEEEDDDSGSEEEEDEDEEIQQPLRRSSRIKSVKRF